MFYRRKGRVIIGWLLFDVSWRIDSEGFSRFLEKETKDHGTKEGTADFEKAMEICGKSLDDIK